MWYVNSILLAVVIWMLAGCGSIPKYDKLRTADDVIENYDNANYKNDGMFITKKGAVVDIKFEEVKGQVKRLEYEKWELGEKLKLREETIKEFEKELMQLRLRMGLAAEKPMPKRKCCTKEGMLYPEEGHAPTNLDEEFTAVQKEDL